MTVLIPSGSSLSVSIVTVVVILFVNIPICIHYIISHTYRTYSVRNIIENIRELLDKSKSIYDRHFYFILNFYCTKFMKQLLARRVLNWLEISDDAKLVYVSRVFCKSNELRLIVVFHNRVVCLDNQLFMCGTLSCTCSEFKSVFVVQMLVCAVCKCIVHLI